MKHDILLVGNGHLATHLARAMKEDNIHFTLAGRNPDHMYSLARAVGVDYQLLSEYSGGHAMAVIAIDDNAIPEVAKLLEGKVDSMVHTSGTVSSKVLAGSTDQYGVCYPLQTFRREANIEWREVPVCIEANTQQLYDHLWDLAHNLSPLVYTVTDEQRKHLHIAAVLVNNFTNHLSAHAQRYCQKHGLDFSILFPLVKKTASTIVSGNNLAGLQTGPASRGDMQTVQEHIHLIMESGEENLAELYSVLSRSILKGFDSPESAAE